MQETDVLNDGNLNTAFFSYDLAGNLITRTDKAGNATGFVYDGLGRKVTSTDSLSNVTQYAYDNRNNMIGVTDANGSTTQFQYDRANHRVKEIKPLGQQTAYQYDGAGNLITRTDPLGQVAAYGYDAAGRQTSISYSSTVSVPASTVTFTYNNVGKLLTWGDGTASGQFEYDQNYLKTSETVNFGNVGGLNPYQLSYSYAYYRNGTKKSFTGPSGDIYQYNYDQANLLSGVTLPDSSAITYNTYNWQAPSKITLPGGTTRTYAYNEFMYPTNIQALDPGQNVIMNYNYTHDKVNNVLTNQTEYGPYNYTYDNTYRLTRAQKPDLSNEQFGYDPVGNRTSSGSDNLPYTYDGNDQLLTIGSDSRTYDANGNMVTRTIGGVTANFFYDAENRLVGVGTSDGTVVAQYHYDPFGRRLWKNVGSVMTYFMYADEGLIGEYNASGQEITSYGYKPNSDLVGDPLFMRQGGQFYFYQNDALGTPKMITSATGAVVWSASYDAFGQAQVGISTVTNNLRLPGQCYDAETGLHYNFQRYYDPRVGRYVQTDPLGFASGDVNLYAYVSNDPVNRVDLTGLLMIFPADPNLYKEELKLRNIVPRNVEKADKMTYYRGLALLKKALSGNSCAIQYYSMLGMNIMSELSDNSGANVFAVDDKYYGFTMGSINSVALGNDAFSDETAMAHTIAHELGHLAHARSGRDISLNNLPCNKCKSPFEDSKNRERDPYGYWAELYVFDNIHD